MQDHKSCIHVSYKDLRRKENNEKKLNIKQDYTPIHCLEDGEKSLFWWRTELKQQARYDVADRSTADSLLNGEWKLLHPVRSFGIIKVHDRLYHGKSEPLYKRKSAVS